MRTRGIYKYKVRLNIDGSKMHPGIHYNKTYDTIAAWGFIRILLATILRNNWKTIQLNYMLAFHQVLFKR